jgi:hypothetical protein
MPFDLQQIVEAFAGRVGLPTQLTDSHLDSLAFGPHTDEIDWLRRETLLQRRTAPEVRSYLEQFGVGTETGPFRIPSDPQRGVMSRVVVPVRHRDLTYGYLWFLDDRQQMTESQIADAVEVAAEIGQILYLSQRVRQADRDLVRDLLADSLEVRQRAVDQMINRNLFPPRRRAAVAVLLHPVGQAGPAAAAASAGPDAADVPVVLDTLLRTGRGGGLPADVLRYTEASHTVLVIPVAGPAAHDTARAVAERARELYLESGDERVKSVVVGLGDPQPDLSYIRESHRQAARAARVAQLVAGADPVAEWRHLGVFRTLTSIPTDQLDSAALDPRVRAILDADDPSLVTTLEAYLDCGCDVKHTCGLLNVHRGTVYYRLQKAESLSGLDLGDGMDRLALHLGVKIARLAGLLTT